MAKYFYARTSAKDQNEARQTEEFKKLGAKNEDIYVEKESGKDVKGRPILKKILDEVHKEDELIVLSLDRLSRDYDGIKTIISELRKKKVLLTVIDSPFLNLNTGNKLLDKTMFDQLIGLMSFVAQNEREKIKERQRQGIEIAKERGKYKGRKTKYHKDAEGADKLVYDRMVEMLKAGNSYNQIAKALKINRSTVYRNAKKLKGKSLL